jgi:hypothetical protein
MGWSMVVNRVQPPPSVSISQYEEKALPSTVMVYVPLAVVGLLSLISAQV